MNVFALETGLEVIRLVILTHVLLESLHISLVEITYTWSRRSPFLYSALLVPLLFHNHLSYVFYFYP